MPVSMRVILLVLGLRGVSSVLVQVGVMRADVTAMQILGVIRLDDKLFGFGLALLSFALIVGLLQGSPLAKVAALIYELVLLWIQAKWWIAVLVYLTGSFHLVLMDNWHLAAPAIVRIAMIVGLLTYRPEE